MNEKLVEQGITRRDFLKVSSGVVATATLGRNLINPKYMSAISDKFLLDTEIKAGFCRMCHYPKCTTKIEVKNGVVTRIMGDPDNPVNKGTLCVRGNSAVQNLYNPYRVKAPMKRTNPEKALDNDPGWVEITWDEALDTVAKQLKDVKEKDPRRLWYFAGFGREATLFHAEIADVVGSPNTGSATGAMCSVHWTAQLSHGTFLEKPDVEHSNYVISVGKTLGPNIASADSSTLALNRALNRGMKLVVIDPRYSPEAAKGTEWLPIRPGTELALFLSMANVMLYEEKRFDEQFIKNRTNAPYLINSDKDYVRNAEGKPLIWDASDKSAKAFDDETLSDPALEGSYQVDGVEVQPAFALFVDQLEQYTPEWAEEWTTIEASTIRRMTNEFLNEAKIGSTIKIGDTVFPLRPACVTMCRGAASHRNGHVSYYMGMMLNMLIGAMDVPGGNLGADVGPFLAPDEDGIVKPNPRSGPAPVKYPPDSLYLQDFYPFGFSIAYRAVETILEPEKHHLDYTPDVMFVFGASLFSKAGKTERISEAMRKIPFTVAIVNHIDEHAMFADVLLPEDSYLERVHMTPPHNLELAYDKQTLGIHGVLAAEPAVARMYNTLQTEEIMMELAERINGLYGEKGLNAILNRKYLKEPYLIDVNKKYSIRELVDRALKSNLGEEGGVDSFKEHGHNYHDLPLEQCYNSFHHPEGTTRYLLFNHHLQNAGRSVKETLGNAGVDLPGWDMEEFLSYYTPIPEWHANAPHEAPSEFDMYAIFWKLPSYLFDISGVTTNPWLQELSEEDPWQLNVLINRKTAQKRGIKDGDKVRITSQFEGQVEATVKLSEFVHPEVVGVPSGLARESAGLNPIAKKGVRYNELLTIQEDTLDPITGGIEISPRVRVELI